METREARQVVERAPSAGELCSLTSIEFVPKVCPNFLEPYWLAPYTDLLDTAVGAGHELVFAAPPQHGKTAVTSAALLLWLIRRPDLRFAYATYGAKRALSVARDVRLMAQRIGLDLSGPVDAPRTSDGGGIVFVGRGNGLTGEPINGFGVVDDPFKDDVDAQSPAMRNRVFEWHTKVWNTRIHPGTSQFVMATRWHDDDLSGRLIREGWRYLNLKALAGEDDPIGRQVGEALSPLWPIATLIKKRKKGPKAFASMYQGEPTPEGDAVFGQPRFYTELPPGGYRVGIGADLAFTRHAWSDFSVIVVLYAYEFKDPDGDLQTFYYVVDVVRMQRPLPHFVSALGGVLSRYPGCKARWYFGVGEHGTADLIDGINGVRINKDTKLVRAQNMAAAWNAGRILLPSGARWVQPLIDEANGFTGVGGERDDQIDALAAAFDEATGKRRGGYASQSEESTFTSGYG